MKKVLLNFSVLFLIVFAFIGCRLNGPSDKEVLEAMESVMSGFAASMDQKGLEVNHTYANAADAVFRNDDDSVVTNMSVYLDGKIFHVYGNCMFSDYEDSASEYILNGELIYNIKYRGSFHSDAGYGEMSCAVSLAGGKIETLEFSFSIDDSGKLEEFLVSANDTEIDLKKEENLFDLFQQFSQKMPG